MDDGTEGSPNLRGHLQRASSGQSSMGGLTPRRGGTDSPKIRADSFASATSNTTAGNGVTSASVASAAGQASGSRPDKNMTLFGKAELNLPLFGDGGPDSPAKSSRAKSPPKKIRGAEYSAAPTEFLAEFFAASSNAAGVRPARRRSSAATSGAMAAAAMASAGTSGGEGATAEAVVAGAADAGADADDVDLTPTEVAALDTLDLIETATPAVKAAEILLTLNPVALRSPYVLSHLSEKLAHFSLDKYAEAHFQYDRRANNSASAAHAHPVEKLLTYQSDLLKAPLTALSSAALGTDAVACFRLICAFLDNSKSSGLQQIDLAMNLLLKLITAPGEFHDEIYCQLCKQTRKNPSPEGLEFGWQLMLLCLATVPPSKRLLPYLCNYISTSLHRLEAAAGVGKFSSAGAASTPLTPQSAAAEAMSASSANAMKFALLALRAVVPAAGASVRTEIPARAEIRALLLGESLEVAVTTMVPTLHRSFAVDSYTTVEALLQMMCDALQVQDSNRRIFTIYEVSCEDDGHAAHGPYHGASHSSAHHATTAVEVELNHQERVLDWVSRCQRAHLSTLSHAHGGSADEREQAYHRALTNPHAGTADHAHGGSGAHTTYKLLFKAKYLYRIVDHAQDAVTMELLYAQCLNDVITARYPHTPADAVVLAAFVLQELCGDYHAGTRTLSELKVKGITLSKLISRSILEQNVINRHELEGKIFTAYKPLAGIGREQARRLYLSFISCWKVFGATFFIVSGQVNNFAEIVLSVSVNSILLLDPVSMQYLAEYKYGDIYSWGHSFDSFVLIIGSKTSQSKSYFKTPQGKDIDGLVRLYHEHHLAVAGNGGGLSAGSVGGDHGISAAGAHSQHKGGANGTLQATGKGTVSFSSQ
jgi:hypothetical protein